jgi:hypothetical protein
MYVRRKCAQLLDRLRQERPRRHQANEERRAIARQLARDDDPHAEDVVAEEVDAGWPAGCSFELELGQEVRWSTGCDDPEEWLDERLGWLSLLPPLLVVRSCLARTRLPGCQVLRQARAKLLGAGCVAVDLDEADDGREPSQEAKPLALGVARRRG